MTAPAALEFRGVTRRFRGNRAAAVEDLSFAVAAGALVALVGESGAGKTTVLRLAAGFEAPDSGTVDIGGERVADASGRFVEPERRSVGLVFQDHALFPHLTVERNVAFGLRRLSAGDRQARTREVLDLVGLKEYAGRMPHTLSGGQQQRVALARALAPQPRVLLFDEPFSSLDPVMRDQLRDDVCEILRAAQATALFVTHDARDALALADRIVVLENGRLVQAGSSAEVYERPADEYVARSFGACNVLDARLSEPGFDTVFGVFPRGERHAHLADGPCRIGLRPDRLQVAVTPGSALKVHGLIYQGSHVEATIRSADDTATLRVHLPQAPEIGSGVTLRCNAGDVLPL